uniref:Uncharacterized protein n=1 Tax=Chromera velia CCMP2878 TaxID=1169474 RepID=A0A0K6S9G6_9ALVE|eukprot:Cvel_7752.t1-p1 / transcript=Cvel_7752.t1 / gene=Cvel_7752 / organism=Chromera_velia_CCMP2878 / gene_product=hypothetical protein / transcript_product=hypothetical protein / location=Cvel_scaffold412:79331-82602(+) / protein_length=608 / sequence_SO=supercontig / SO=protein_coding / is_pseudo=false
MSCVVGCSTTQEFLGDSVDILNTKAAPSHCCQETLPLPVVFSSREETEALRETQGSPSPAVTETLYIFLERERERFVEGEGVGGISSSGGACGGFLEGREGSMVSLVRRRLNAVRVDHDTNVTAAPRSSDWQASEEDPKSTTGERDSALDQPNVGPRGDLSSLGSLGGGHGDFLRLPTLMTSVEEEEEEGQGGGERNRDGREKAGGSLSEDAREADEEREEVAMNARMSDLLDREDGGYVTVEGQRTASVQTDSETPALRVAVGRGTGREGVGGMLGLSSAWGGDGECDDLHPVDATMASLSEKKEKETATSSSSSFLRRDPVHFYTFVSAERAQLQRPQEDLGASLSVLARGCAGFSGDAVRGDVEGEAVRGDVEGEAVRGDVEEERNPDNRVDDSTPELRSLPSAKSETARLITDRGGGARQCNGRGERERHERRSMSVIDRRVPPNAHSHATDRVQICSSSSLSLGVGRPMPLPSFSFPGQTMSPMKNQKRQGAPPHPHTHQHSVPGRRFCLPLLSSHKPYRLMATGHGCLSVVPAELQTNEGSHTAGLSVLPPHQPAHLLVPELSNYNNNSLPSSATPPHITPPMSLVHSTLPTNSHLCRGLCN